MPGMSGPPLPHYTLGASDKEHRRLVSLAAHEEDRVIDACRRAGVGEGATVIDLGCGPLGALAALAGVVGKTGTVIGVDASERALTKARTLLPQDAWPQVRLVRADVSQVTLAQLEVEERVDLAYSRLMLLHQEAPGEVLRTIAGLLRPGAPLIAHEPSDLAAHAPASEPPVAAMTRVWELVIGAARARGAATDFGRRGRAYLEEAGFDVESHRAYYVHYAPAVGFEIPRVALHSLRPVLDAHGLADPAEVAELDAELGAAKERRDVQWVSSPLMFEWIGRRR
jgi:SAM-dependent methyltransferase